MTSCYPTREMELSCQLEISFEDHENKAVVKNMVILPGAIISAIEINPGELVYLWICDSMYGCFDFTKILDPEIDLIKITQKDDNQILYTSSSFLDPVIEFNLIDKTSLMNHKTILEDPLLEDDFHKTNIKEINENQETILLQLCPVL